MSPMIEVWISRLGGVAALATLAVALVGIAGSGRRPVGRAEGPGARYLRWPVLAAATVTYAAVMLLLWRPLPIHPSDPARTTLAVLGAAIYFPSLGLYLWGLYALGAMFGAASGFGVRLYAGHRLVTDGPFAVVRHPMYLAVFLAGIGSLLIYRTWATLFFASNMLGLIVRARREERALASEFGEEWRAYAARVPAFLPTLRRRARVAEVRDPGHSGD
jgi:protein-S-isoprenylcysteine O-methyltransferase Ste14